MKAPKQSGPVLAAAPWRRVPLLVWRSPSVVVAVAGAALILAVTGAAAPLFLSSAANAALADQLVSRCPANTGRVFAAGQIGGREVPAGRGPAVSAATVRQRRERAIQEAIGGVNHLGPAIRSVRSQPLDVIGPGGADRRVRSTVIWRQGGLDHV